MERWLMLLINFERLQILVFDIINQLQMKTSQKYSLQKITFCENVSIDKNSLLSLKVKEKINKQNWDFDYGTWKTFKGKQILKLIQQAKIQELRLNWNNHSQIIHQIKYVTFPSLKVLHLSHNHITSIETLQNIQLSSLTTLWLKNNLISNISSFRKLKIPKIQWITLNGNKINQLHSVSELNFPSLKTLWIDSLKEGNIDETIQGENLQWIIKLRSQKMEYIRLNNEKRLRIQIIDLLKNNKNK